MTSPSRIFTIDRAAAASTEAKNKKRSPLLFCVVSSIDEIVETVAPRFSYLTKRQSEVLCCVAEGLTASEAGEKMFIGCRSVESHKRNICLLGVKGRYEMVLTALLYAAVSGRKSGFPEIGELRLAKRQLELFESVGRGNSCREMAEEFGITEKTVHKHFYYINKK